MWLGSSGFVFPALDQVEEEAEGHQPHLGLGEVEVADAHVHKPSEDSVYAVISSAAGSWGSFGSEVMSRRVPFTSAVVIASR